jgi:hypothetical protein
MSFEIFNSRGSVRDMSEFTAEELASLTPERRIVFDRLRESVLACESAKKAVSDGVADLAAKVRIFQTATTRHPQTTAERERIRREEWEQMKRAGIING